MVNLALYKKYVNMKKILFSVSLLFTGFFAFAQSGVGIGIELPHPTALLDLRGGNKGLLVPQVKLATLKDATVINGGIPFNGLLIFNTTTSNELRPGFYYWGEDYSDATKASKWIALGDDLNAALGLKPQITMSVVNGKLIISDPKGEVASVPIIDLQILTTLDRDPAKKGDYIYLNEAKQPFKITVVGDVIENFQEIVNAGTVNTILEGIVNKFAKNPWLVQGGSTIATLDTQNIAHSGTVAIGGNALLTNPKATNTKLSVNGDVISSGKFFTANSLYADYVFEKYFTGTSNLNLRYEFKSLEYVKDYIEKYNHLPGVTKISDVSRTEDGKYLIDFTELSIQQLEKIEELYLHTIEQQDKISALSNKVDEMELRLQTLELLLNNK